jgi:outer membrane protein TolC
LPLWFWKPAFNIKESAYGLKASLAGQKNMELMTVYAGKELFIKLQTLERQLELYKTTFLPQAEQAFKVIEVSYRSGKEDFLMLLDSERALLDFQIDYYKSFSEYYQNLAELERISGVELK